jgi:hypothetical protein
LTLKEATSMPPPLHLQSDGKTATLSAFPARILPVIRKREQFWALLLNVTAKSVQPQNCNLARRVPRVKTIVIMTGPGIAPYNSFKDVPRTIL